MDAKAASLPYRPCVGVMLINAQGLVFAGQRIDSPIPAWQMPQGGIDDGALLHAFGPVDPGFGHFARHRGAAAGSARC